MKKILITGASGFIGRHVVEELASRREYDITAVVSGRKEINFPENVHVEKTDLLKPEAVDNLIDKVQPELCCHFAWTLDTSGFKASPLNLQWLETSIRILRLFVKNGGEKFLFAGSSSEYAVKSGISEERTPPNSHITVYGQSKVAFEQIAENFCMENRVNLITCRYFYAYGPWDIKSDGAIPTAITSMLNGKEFVCKAPNNVWDFVYIKDCVKATIDLLQIGSRGRYNIASGQPVTMREAFTTIAKDLGTEHLLRFENDSQSPLYMIADTSKLTKEIGTFPSTSFEQGIKETIKWWKSR